MGSSIVPLLLLAVASGRAVLGGCLVYEGAPEWVCADCDRSFGALRLPTGEE